MKGNWIFLPKNLSFGRLNFIVIEIIIITWLKSG